MSGYYPGYPYGAPPLYGGVPPPPPPITPTGYYAQAPPAPPPQHHHQHSHSHSRSRSRSQSRSPPVKIGIIDGDDRGRRFDAFLPMPEGRGRRQSSVSRERAYDDARRVIEDEERRRKEEREQWERELEKRDRKREEEREQWKRDEEKKAEKAKEAQKEAVRKAKEAEEEERERVKEIEKKYEERKKKEEEEKKKEKERFKEDYESKLRKDLRNFGISDRTIERIVTHEQDSEGHAKASGHGVNSHALVRSMDPDRPWPRIHLDYIDVATLQYFDLEWVESPDNRNYVIIQQYLSDRDLDRLFEHTRRLRKKEKNRLQIKAAPEEPEFEFVRRRPSNARRKSSARDKSPAREKSSDRRGKLAAWMFS